MSEQRGYTHIEVLRKEIMQMRESGQTLRQIAEHFGFKDKYVVKQFLTRERRRQCKREAGILPRRRGRPPKGQREQTSETEKDYEIKRLRMENHLLRDFLKLAGRR